MAKKPRIMAKGKPPIMRHPLFPATVAIWFGALFGLGSLAIRPTLIEAIVLQLQLDALLPSLAPPLGATTRIMLALIMAGLGGLLGATLARKMALPKPVVRERKRTANAVRNAQKAVLSFGNRGDSSEQSQPAPGRKRALALTVEDERHPDLEDYAPLPGGSPQILDVSEFDLEGFESVDDNPDEQEAAQAGNDTVSFDSGMFETDSSLASTTPEPIEAASEFAPSEFQTPDLDGSEAMDSKDYNAFHDENSDVEPVPPEDAQIFSSEPVSNDFGLEKAVQDSDPTAPDPFAAPARHSLPAPQQLPEPGELESLAANPASPLPRFDADADQVNPNETLHAQSAFHTAPKQPLFDRAAEAADAPTPKSNETTEDEEQGGREVPFAAPQPFSAPEDSAPSFATPLADEDDFWDEQDDNQFDVDKALGRTADAPLSPANTLSSGDEATPAIPQPFDSPHESAESPSPVEPTHEAGVDPEADWSEEGISVDSKHTFNGEDIAAPALGSETDEAKSDIAPAKPERTPAAAERINGADLEDLSQVELLERLALSLERRREDSARAAEEAAIAAQEAAKAAEAATMAQEPEPESAPEPELAATPAPNIPAAMRPIGIDDGEDEDALVPSFVPPRQIGMKPAEAMTEAVTAQEPASEPDSEPKIPEAFSAEAADATTADDEEEARVLEEGYSSLLSLSRDEGESQKFVRIEEPTPEDDTIEPVVVFPGQGTNSGVSFDKSEQPSNDHEVAEIDAAQSQTAQDIQDNPFAKRASAPEADLQSEPHAPNARPGQPSQDSAEAERALRTALATLQRMSGAA